MIVSVLSKELQQYQPASVVLDIPHEMMAMLKYYFKPEIRRNWLKVMKA